MAKIKEADKPLVMRESRGTLVYPLVLVLWGIYLFAVYNTPNETIVSAFDITERTAVALRFTIAVPYLLMWLAIGYAFVRLLTYSDIINKSKESAAFRYFAYGTAVLLGGLILTAILAGLRSMFGDGAHNLNVELRPLLTILINYGYTVLYMAAFGLFFFAAHKLRTNEKIAFNTKGFLLLAVPLLALAYVWLEIIFSNPTRGVVVEGQTTPVYYLRDSLIILTIFVPSIVAWFCGIGAVVNMRSYQTKVKGIIYKRALRYFVLGLTGMTLGSILLQSLLSLGVDQLIGFGLGVFLAILYFFLLVQAFGFVYMALGAKQLTKIETV